MKCISGKARNIKGNSSKQKCIVLLCCPDSQVAITSHCDVKSFSSYPNLLCQSRCFRHLRSYRACHGDPNIARSQHESHPEPTLLIKFTLEAFG